MAVFHPVCLLVPYSFFFILSSADNVLVFNSGRTVKLANFQSAMHMDNESSIGVGTLKGLSPHFAAPEVGGIYLKRVESVSHYVLEVGNIIVSYKFKPKCLSLLVRIEVHDFPSVFSHFVLYYMYYKVEAQSLASLPGPRLPSQGLGSKAT